MVGKQEGVAKREGFKVLNDQDLLNGVEGRARQLEAELAGHSLFQEEAVAVGDDATAEAHGEEVAKLKKRLEVVHARRDALKANIKADEKPAPASS